MTALNVNVRFVVYLATLSQLQKLVYVEQEGGMLL